jgi:pyruvate kinase
VTFSARGTRTSMNGLIDKNLSTKRKTKIICTIGPSSWDEDMMGKLLDAGLDIARFTFPYNQKSATNNYDTVVPRFRAVCARKGSSAAVMFDTKGPEIRTAMLKDRVSVVLVEEQEVLVEAVGDAYTSWEGYSNEIETRIGISYMKLCQTVKLRDKIRLEDGTITLVAVEKVSNTVLKCRVQHGGRLGENGGVVIPGVDLGLPTLTRQDLDNLERVCIKHDMDYVAVSYVQSSRDVFDVRRFLDKIGGKKVKIISKIEDVNGLRNIDEIIEASDGIMVSRGDLGIHIPTDKVALAQKMIITKCNVAGKFVITSRQMLESMVNSPFPTRAEMTDVANAVFDGTDCTTLSEETARGKYPLESLNTMANVVANAELGLDYYSLFLFIRFWNYHRKDIDPLEATLANAAKSSIELSEDSDGNEICVYVCVSVYMCGVE